MLNAIRILLLVSLIGAQVGPTALMLTTPCESCQDARVSGEAIGTDCLVCAGCCVGVAEHLVAPPSLAVLMPLAGAAPLEGVLTLPPRLTEILHIPESTPA